MGKKNKKQESKLSWFLYILLIALILSYAVTSIAILGLLAFLLIVLILVFEVKSSIKKEGTKKSIIDIVSAIGAAIVVWILLIVFLHTSAPVDAVSSCSMLPALHRGDLVVLHGIDNISAFISNNHVPVVNLSKSEFEKMQNNMSSEFLTFYAYFNNKSKISYTIPGNAPYKVGLYNTQCVSTEIYLNKMNLLYTCYVPQQNQSSNLIRYGYSRGTFSLNNQTYKAIYTSQISIGNETIGDNYTAPIIVYQTTRKDTFYPESIIHRLYAVLNVSGSYYFLTRGDNNQALDIEFGNYPANRSNVVGYVIADIPIVGYVKLLLSGQIETPAGCNQLLSP